MHGVLDGIGDQIGDMLGVHISLDGEQDLFEGVFNARDCLVPEGVTLLYHSLCVFLHLHKSLSLL